MNDDRSNLTIGVVDGEGSMAGEERLTSEVADREGFTVGVERLAP